MSNLSQAETHLPHASRPSPLKISGLRTHCRCSTWTESLASVAKARGLSWLAGVGLCRTSSSSHEDQAWRAGGKTRGAQPGNHTFRQTQT